MPTTDSFRINTKEVDQSQSVRPEANNVGATVIEASKGPEQPIKIDRGNTNKILNIFGIPTSSVPQVYDAIKYNEEASIWISAPSKNGKYGGVYVTKTGTQAFTSGFTSKSSVTFSTIAVKETLGTGDGSTNNFSITLDDYTHYNNVSIVIKVDDTALTAYSVTDAATEVITATELVSGSYVRATGVVDVTFASAPASASVITAEYTVDRSSDAYFTLFNANPQVDDLGIITTFNSTDSTFSIEAAIKDADGVYSEIEGSPFVVSLTSGTKDGFGNNIYITDVFEDNEYITPAINTALALSTFQVTRTANELIAIGDGSTKTFTYTLTNYSAYVDQSVDITVNGTTINVTASDAATEVLTTTPDVGSGSLVRATGALSFTFDTAPAADSLIRATYSYISNVDATYVDMDGGLRGDAITGSDLIRGWAYFQNVNTYPADIFFDVSGNQNIPTTFNTLRNTYQKYKAYILPLPNATLASVIATKTSYGVANRGVYYYWNRFRVSNQYNDDSLWTPATGAIAKKHAQMVDVFNGLAPAWIDENGHGGQLDLSVLEQAYDPREEDLQTADTSHINPIHNDIVYGPLIKSQRTSLTIESDYSYIGHSRTADYIISNIVSQVLPYQLVKLNDTFHRGQVKANADTIITPLAGAPYNLLRDFLVKCDSENNTSEILATRKFLLQVTVKFTPFSEQVDFFFINVRQNVEVSGSGV